MADIWKTMKDRLVVTIVMNRKSYMRFLLAVFTLTLGDLERSNVGYMCVRPWPPVSQRCL